MDNARMWLTYLNYRDRHFFAWLEYSEVVWSLYPDASSHEQRSGYHWFAEVGTQRGPFKASLMAALASGLTRDEPDSTISLPHSSSGPGAV